MIESDTDAVSALPADEAALYECIKLRIRDVSAYAVDGHFSFSALAEAAGNKDDSEVRVGGLIGRARFDFGEVLVMWELWHPAHMLTSGFDSSLEISMKSMRESSRLSASLLSQHPSAPGGASWCIALCFVMLLGCTGFLT